MQSRTLVVVVMAASTRVLTSPVVTHAGEAVSCDHKPPRGRLPVGPRPGVAAAPRDDDSDDHRDKDKCNTAYEVASTGALSDERARLHDRGFPSPGVRPKRYFLIQ
jgi:hypothetical protein